MNTTNKSKLGKESAFPEIYTNPLTERITSTNGVSKRLYIAKSILCSFLLSPHNSYNLYDSTYDEMVEKSYELADKLLKKENE